MGQAPFAPGYVFPSPQEPCDRQKFSHPELQHPRAAGGVQVTPWLQRQSTPQPCLWVPGPFCRLCGGAPAAYKTTGGFRGLGELPMAQSIPSVRIRGSVGNFQPHARTQLLGGTVHDPRAWPQLGCCWGGSTLQTSSLNEQSLLHISWIRHM